MDRVFKLTKRTFKHQLAVVFAGIVIVLAILIFRFKFYSMDKEKFDGWIYLTIVLILLITTIVKSNKIIGSIMIGNEMIIVKIDQKIEKFDFRESKPEFIKFIYNGIKGDNSANALIGIGSFYSFSGANNKIEFAFNKEKFSYRFLIDNRHRFDSLIDLINELRQDGFKIYYERNV